MNRNTENNGNGYAEAANKNINIKSKKLAGLISANFFEMLNMK